MGAEPETPNAIEFGEPWLLCEYLATPGDREDGAQLADVLQPEWIGLVGSEVGMHARFELAPLFFQVRQPRAADGEEPDGLLPVQPLTGVVMRFESSDTEHGIQRRDRRVRTRPHLEP